MPSGKLFGQVQHLTQFFGPIVFIIERVRDQRTLQMKPSRMYDPGKRFDGRRLSTRLIVEQCGMRGARTGSKCSQRKRGTVSHFSQGHSRVHPTMVFN